MAKLESCFCGCSTRSGTMIIAVLCIFTSLANIIKNSCALAKGNDPSEGLRQINLTASVFQLLLSLAVVYGVGNRRHLFLGPWIVYQTILLINLTMWLILIISDFIVTASAGCIFLGVFLGVAAILLQLYFVWVVKSEYDNIKEEGQPQPGNGGRSNICIKPVV